MSAPEAEKNVQENPTGTEDKEEPGSLIFFVAVFFFRVVFYFVFVGAAGRYRGPAAVLDDGVELDTAAHHINATFQAAAVPRVDQPADSECILLENRYYPCTLPVSVCKKECRLTQISKLVGLAEAFFGLNVGAKYRIGTRVQVFISFCSKLFFLFVCFPSVGGSVQSWRRCVVPPWPFQREG